MEEQLSVAQITRADSRKWHFIYKTTCLVTGCWYIGMHSSSRLDDGYLGSGKRLWYSIQKYGKENHVREVVEFCSDRKSLAAREKEIVNENLLNEKQCLNLMVGGTGGWELSNTDLLKRLKQAGQKAMMLKKNHSESTSKGLKTRIRNDPEKYREWQLRGIEAASGDKANAKRKKTFEDIGHQQGEKNSNFGKRNRVMTKENVSKRISLDEVENYLANGWVIGFKK